MEKRTLKFQCLITMAKFSKIISVGYLMNTNRYTLTGRFSDTDMELAVRKFHAREVATTEKVYSY